MAKISVQQRKYFVTRIENSINDKIETLRQSNAAEVQNISAAAYNKYLKLLKVDKDIKRYEKLDLEHSKLQAKLIQVYDSVKTSQINANKSVNSWNHNYPHLYTSSTAVNINEAKKRAATDELHGVNELEGLKATVNNILKGADVPLLGE